VELPECKAGYNEALAIIQKLQIATKAMVPPAATEIIREFGKDPFLILVSCILSLRTKDTVSLPASQRLFNIAKTPQQLLKVPLGTLERIIYPVGFYRNKSRHLHELSADLLDRFKGVVPSTEAELLTLKGVGRKTANLVLGQGFDIPAICVDIHVHRISNRLGIIKTKTPEETEIALKKILPKEQWVEFNRLLVMWGQNVCVPISPRCSTCPLFTQCKRVGVTKKR
jgi:endonuclease-3